MRSFPSIFLIYDMKNNRFEELEEQKVFKDISDVADRLGMECYVIGGFVRDLILGLPNDDIDIVVVGSGIDMATAFSNLVGGDLSVYKSYGTASVKCYSGLEVEFVGARKESYIRGSRNPIVESGTLQDDQLRRDFTINAMAICLNKSRFGELVDPFNGQSDIADRIIRTPTNPDVTFSDDPLRILRCIRFATRLEFNIDQETLQSLIANVDRLSIIVQERVTSEINKILMSNNPARGITLLGEYGILRRYIPELTALNSNPEVHHKNNFTHSIAVLNNMSKISNNLWLRWAALLHDVGKSVTEKYYPGIGWTYYNHEYESPGLIKKIFERLKLPLGNELSYVMKLARLHMSPQRIANENVTDSAVRRLCFEAGEDIDDLITLCECDLTTKNLAKKQGFIERYEKVRETIEDLKKRDFIRLFQPCIDGDEIMRLLNLRPGKKVGILKDFLKNSILDNIVQNEYEPLKNLLITKARELGYV